MPDHGLVRVRSLFHNTDDPSAVLDEDIESILHAIERVVFGPEREGAVKGHDERPLCFFVLQLFQKELYEGLGALIIKEPAVSCVNVGVLAFHLSRDWTNEKWKRG